MSAPTVGPGRSWTLGVAESRNGGAIRCISPIVGCITAGHIPRCASWASLKSSEIDRTGAARSPFWRRSFTTSSRSRRAVHAPIRGTDAVTGLPYSADDPTLLLWIHTTLVDGFLGAYRRFVKPLAQDEADRYVSEMIRQAELVGLKAGEVPPTERENSRFIESCRPMLQVSRHALEAVDTVLRPPLATWKRPFWWVVGQASVSLLPEYARQMYGLPRHRSERAVRPVVRRAALAARRRLEPPAVLQHARQRALAAGYRW